MTPTLTKERAARTPHGLNTGRTYPSKHGPLKITEIAARAGCAESTARRYVSDGVMTADKFIEWRVNKERER